jgi:tRNA(fMet)-specific endonuclease VapC
MSGSFLLDTNIVIALFANDQAVIASLTAADVVCVPAIALGELYFGARKSGRSADNLVRIDEFADTASVLACNGETAKHYSVIKHTPRAKGQPIPENDIWIAALASQHQLTLVTRDSHFQQVDGLPITGWSS